MHIYAVHWVNCTVQLHTELLVMVVHGQENYYEYLSILAPN
jgi:hypothetical protein